jgi:hypothetical protein
MSSTFGAAYFDVLLDGIGRGRDSEVSVVHIPGSATNVIDIGGQGELRLSLGLYFGTESNYFVLEGLVGTQATLTIPDGTYSDAFLRSVRRTWRNSNGSQTKADADFIIPY